MSDQEELKYTLSDNSLAHIALAEIQINRNNFGAKTSIDELVKLSQGKLNKQRKEEVLAQLESDEKLYRVWMALPAEFSSESALSTQAETNSKSFKSRVNDFINSLFSWHSLAPLAFGLLFGLSLTLDNSDKSDLVNNVEVAHLNQPLDAPQKASIDRLTSNLEPQEIIDIASSNNNFIVVMYKQNEDTGVKIFEVEENDGDINFNIHNQFLISESGNSDIKIISFDGSLLTYSIGKETREVMVKK